MKHEDAFKIDFPVAPDPVACLRQDLLRASRSIRITLWLGPVAACAGVLGAVYGAPLVGILVSFGMSGIALFVQTASIGFSRNRLSERIEDLRTMRRAAGSYWSVCGGLDHCLAAHEAVLAEVVKDG